MLEKIILYLNGLSLDDFWDHHLLVEGADSHHWLDLVEGQWDTLELGDILDHLGEDGLVASEVFDFVDLVGKDLVEDDLVSQGKVLLGEDVEKVHLVDNINVLELVVDEVLLGKDIEKVELSHGVEGIELLVVSVHHTGNEWVELGHHHLFLQFLWVQGADHVVSDDHLVQQKLLDEFNIDVLLEEEVLEELNINVFLEEHVHAKLVTEDGGIKVHSLGEDDFLQKVGINILLDEKVGDELVSEDVFNVDVLVDEEFLKEDILDKLVSEDGVDSTEWDHLDFSGDGVNNFLDGGGLINVVQVRVDLVQNVLVEETILKGKVLVVDGGGHGEFSFVISDEWEDILVHNSLLLEGGGGVVLEKLDNGKNKLVEKFWLNKVLLEGWDGPELLEVDGLDELLEYWVLDVLTEEGKAHVFLEELSCEEFIDGEDLGVNKVSLHVVGEVFVEEILLSVHVHHWVAQFLHEELVLSVLLVQEEGLTLSVLEHVKGLAGNNGHEHSSNHEGFHVGYLVC
jgi:hypothetical protein